MKNSSADQVILEILSVMKSHLTSHQIFEEVKKRLPAINPSTVYRSLERLVSIGKVSISDMGLGATVYELTGDELHHHLVCQRCGHITLVSNDQVAPLILQLEKTHHFTIKTNHLVLFGVCQHCQNDSD